MQLLIGMARGPRVRQEDALLVINRVFQESSLPADCITHDGEPALALVADGMGGGQDGDWCARRLCELLSETPSDELPLGPEFADHLAGMQDRLSGQAVTSYCGTALAGVLVHAGQATVFNVGDSRVYKRRADGQLTRLSHDHGLVQELVDAGQVSPEEAFLHPQKHILTFGMGPAFAPQWQEGTAAHVTLDDLQPGDSLFICTDGVSDTIPENVLATCLRSFDLEVADQLQRELAERGGDNASFIWLQP